MNKGVVSVRRFFLLFCCLYGCWTHAAHKFKRKRDPYPKPKVESPTPTKPIASARNQEIPKGSSVSNNSPRPIVQVKGGFGYAEKAGLKPGKRYKGGNSIPEEKPITLGSQTYTAPPSEYITLQRTPKDSPPSKPCLSSNTRNEQAGPHPNPHVKRFLVPRQSNFPPAPTPKDAASSTYRELETPPLEKSGLVVIPATFSKPAKRPKQKEQQPTNDSSSRIRVDSQSIPQKVFTFYMRQFLPPEEQHVVRSVSTLSAGSTTSSSVPSMPPLGTDMGPTAHSKGSHSAPSLEPPYIYTPLRPISQKLQKRCFIDEFGVIPSPWVRRGNYGMVFPVVHKPTKTQFVVKQISGEAVKADPTVIVREELVHGVLEHPNIVKFHCTMVNEKTGSVLFLLEYVDGGTLEEYMQTAKTDDQHTKIRILAQLSVAIEYLHALGVAHRDIKPENILLTRELQPKLIDFGLSVHENDFFAKTPVGTPLFFAPEVFDMRLAFNRRASDLYALGLVAYFMAVGNDYFDDELTTVQYYEMRRSTLTVPIKNTGSRDLDYLLSILLEPDGSRRWRSFYSGATFRTFRIFTNIDWEGLNKPSVK